MTQDYLPDSCRIIAELPDDEKRTPCPVFTTANGKKHPQHYFVLVYLEDTVVEWRCMYCLEYLTRKRLVVGQQKLF